MSFMPSVGTVVRLADGRVGVVSAVSSDGGDDRMLFQDGQEERSDAWKIAETLTDEPEVCADPAAVLADDPAR